jgi:hypothetical protein
MDKKCVENENLFIFSIFISFMKIWALITVLIIFSLCISESPTTTPPETTPSPTHPPTTPPAVEDLSAYGNLTPEIIKAIQNYDDNVELGPGETAYAEFMNKDTSLFNYVYKITPENLDTLQLYDDVHGENPSITAYKPYFFAHPDQFEEGTAIRTYGKDFPLDDLIELRGITDDQSASNLLSEIKGSEHKELLLDYFTEDNEINDKDFFVADNTNHALLKAILADSKIKDHEDDLITRLADNKQIDRFTLEPEEKLAIYKLVYGKKISLENVSTDEIGKQTGEKIFYDAVYDNLFKTEDGRYLINIKVNPKGDKYPAAFYLPGDVIRVVTRGPQFGYMDVLEKTNEMFDRYYESFHKFIASHPELQKGASDSDFTYCANYAKGMSTGIPWKEAWFDLRCYNNPSTTIEINYGCELTPGLMFFPDEIRDSEYYRNFWIGIPKKEPAIVDLDAEGPEMGPIHEAYIYIYDNFDDSYGPFAADDIIGLSKDGTISMRIGYNPRISRDVWVRKNFISYYIAENYEDWMDTMNFFMEHVFNEDSE